MKPLRPLILPALTGLTLLLGVGCSSRPDYVIDDDRMVALLVDVHKAEGIIEVQSEQYPSDQEKQQLVGAVLEKHGVTKAEYDSSLVWYSTHLKNFIRIYNKVRETVNEEQSALARQDSVALLLNPTEDAALLPLRATYVVLDAQYSADTWQAQWQADENLLAGDSVAWYWQMQHLPSGAYAVATLTFSYDRDSMTSVTRVDRVGGVGTLSAVADSTLKLQQVSVSLQVRSQSDTTVTPPILVDTLSLIRYHVHNKL
jgi:hypothetical protein